MLAGGAAALADSLAENIANLRRHLPDVRLELMRSPVSGRSPGPVADICFVSSTGQAKALRALCAGRLLQLCLMIETGDGREGVPPTLAIHEAERIALLEGVALVGLATNLACARPSAPLAKGLATFAKVAANVVTMFDAGSSRSASEINYPFLFSAGGSGLLRLLVEAGDRDSAAALFGPVSELRCGEAILLGRIPSGDSPCLYLPGTCRDAFVLQGPVLEVFKKDGKIQAMVGFGVQDVGRAPIVPLQEGIAPTDITSDYLVIAPTGGARRSVKIGDRLAFIPTYYALLAAMTSPYVEKRFIT